MKILAILGIWTGITSILAIYKGVMLPTKFDSYALYLVMVLHCLGELLNDENG